MSLLPKLILSISLLTLCLPKNASALMCSGSELVERDTNRPYYLSEEYLSRRNEQHEQLRFEYGMMFGALGAYEFSPSMTPAADGTLSSSDRNMQAHVESAIASAIRTQNLRKDFCLHWTRASTLPAERVMYATYAMGYLVTIDSFMLALERSLYQVVGSRDLNLISGREYGRALAQMDESTFVVHLPPQSELEIDKWLMKSPDEFIAGEQWLHAIIDGVKIPRGFRDFITRYLRLRRIMVRFSSDTPDLIRGHNPYFPCLVRQLDKLIKVR